MAAEAVGQLRAVERAGLTAYFAGASFAAAAARHGLPGEHLAGTVAQATDLLVGRHTSPERVAG